MSDKYKCSVCGFESESTEEFAVEISCRHRLLRIVEMFGAENIFVCWPCYLKALGVQPKNSSTKQRVIENAVHGLSRVLCLYEVGSVMYLYYKDLLERFGNRKMIDEFAARTEVEYNSLKEDKRISGMMKDYSEKISVELQKQREDDAARNSI